jgi:HAD superfamily hydrolase (TIGR01509 family)
MQAVIFDCDGTLVESERLANEVLVELVGEHGLNISADYALTQFRGAKMADSIAHLEGLLGKSLPDDFVPTLRTRCAEAFHDRLQPVDGALELVRSLSVPCCVASSGPMAKMQLTLSITGLAPYFEGRLFSSYKIGSWKPEPDLFLHAAHALSVAPESCAVVEDSLPGIKAGVAAGMQVFALQMHATDITMPDNVTVLRHLSELRRYDPTAFQAKC